MTLAEAKAAPEGSHSGKCVYDGQPAQGRVAGRLTGMLSFPIFVCEGCLNQLYRGPSWQPRDKAAPEEDG